MGRGRNGSRGRRVGCPGCALLRFASASQAVGGNQLEGDSAEDALHLPGQLVELGSDLLGMEAAAVLVGQADIPVLRVHPCRFQESPHLHARLCQHIGPTSAQGGRRSDGGRRFPHDLPHRGRAAPPLGGSCRAGRRHPGGTAQRGQFLFQSV